MPFITNLKFKKAMTALATISVYFCFPLSAHAKDDAKICSAYAKIGGFMAESLLDQTLKDIILMTQDKNPELSAKITEGLLSEWSAKELTSMAKLGEKNLAYIAESAGQVSMQLLMSGQTASKEETIDTLNRNCLAIGYKNIIENQKAAQKAINASIK